MCLLRGCALSLPPKIPAVPTDLRTRPGCRPGGTQHTRLKHLCCKGRFFGQGLYPSPKDEDSFFCPGSVKKIPNPEKGKRAWLNFYFFHEMKLNIT